MPYTERCAWTTLWIVDPLDGTKEFIKRNGEFTVNIALVRNSVPVMGVIYLPSGNASFFQCNLQFRETDVSGMPQLQIYRDYP